MIPGSGNYLVDAMDREEEETIRREREEREEKRREDCDE